MSSRADQKPPARFRWLKQPRRFARNTRAASAVEFALLALPLFALIFAALQWAIVLMAEQELETATEKAARLVMTGQVSSTSSASNYLSQSDFQKKVCTYLVALFNCSNVMVNMQTASTWANASTSAPSYATLQQNTWSYTTGTVGQVVVLQVMYEWPIVSSLLGFNLANLSNGTRLLMATSVFQNEP
jgi:Flp pilus assembly protein TadG